MLPYILAAVGGYLIGDSMKGKQYAKGGMMARGGWIEKPMTGGRKKYVKESNDYKHEIFKQADGKYFVSTTILSSKSGVDEYSQTYESNISDDFNSLEEAKKYVANKYADGGMMAKGGFYEGQSVFYVPTNNSKLDKSVRNLFNKYANRELVIEKIGLEKPYNTAKVFDRNTGEKLSFDLVLNPKYVQQYADGGMMADGGLTPMQGGEVDNYVEVNGTFYKKGTPQDVINALENARNNRTIVKIFYGDPETGRDWHEENDTTGTIGRSTGSIKIPLLIPTSRSSGGGSILTENIVKIKDTQSGRVLYQNKNYKQPNIEILESTTDGYTHDVFIDGELYSRHKSKRSAEMLKSKMM